LFQCPLFFKEGIGGVKFMRILIIDDEESMRHMLSIILKKGRL